MAFTARDPSGPDILYPPGTRPTDDRSREPAYFCDLNLDQVVAEICTAGSDYDLTGHYRRRLADPDAIAYRQEVFTDLERAEVSVVVRAFVERRLVAEYARRTKEIREDDHGLHHYYHERFFLNAVQDYCHAVIDLASGLRAAGPRSRGLTAVVAYLTGYLNSNAFRALHAEATRLEDELSAVRYVIAIRDDRITVAAYDDEPDYGEQVAATFQRFRRRDGTRLLPWAREWESYAATHVLDLVAKLYPDLFAALDAFCARNLGYFDTALAALDRDVQFYLAYLDYIAPLRAAGLAFSYPRTSPSSKTEQALDTFDLALAHKLHANGSQVVCNDVTLDGPERILVVSGPNNGGKTTLARTVGQLHHLAQLGCAVPGRDAHLFICDQIFTHFERSEDSASLTGKLQDELNRLYAGFRAATPASLIIINEMFNSTVAADALYLSSRILDKVTELDALCVCVTFLDELASLNAKTVSMVSTVSPGDPAIRTHKLVRRPADGRAYAHAIADKHGLGFDRLVEVLTR